MHTRRHPSRLSWAGAFLPLALLAVQACSDSGGPSAPVAETTPTAWIYDGRRMLNCRLDDGTLTRLRLPGASLPLDDAAPDGTAGLEAGSPEMYLQWLVPSPDDRFLVYGLANAASAVRLYAWDVQGKAERSLGEGPFSQVRFLSRPTGVLATVEATGVTLHALPAGGSARRDGVVCDALVAGDRVLVSLALGNDPSACGTGVEHRVLRWDGAGIAEAPLVLPWSGPEVFLDAYAASLSRDGKALMTAYRRTEPEATQHPLVECDLPAATCVEVATEGRLDLTWGPEDAYRNLSRDGRTRAFAEATRTRSDLLRIDAGGATRTIEAGGTIQSVQACDGASEVFFLASTGPRDPHTGDTSGIRVARVGVREGEPQTVWAAARSSYEPVGFTASDARDRILVTEYESETGTDVLTFFPRQARIVDVATGTAGGPLGGGGVPAVWGRDLRHVLILQDRGPAGTTLVAGDPAGEMSAVASWADPRQRVFRIASHACPGWGCGGRPSCATQAALASRAAVSLDGAGATWAIDEAVTVAEATDPTPAGPGRVVLGGPAGTRAFTVDLPPPFRLPLAPGERVFVHATQETDPAGGPPRQVFTAWDDAEPATFRVLFAGGTGVARGWDGNGLCGGKAPCPVLSFGRTGCTPDAVPGCGRVDHPPVVLWQEGWAWSMQAEQGQDRPTGRARITVFATDRPVDGACAAYGDGTAYVLVTGQ